MERDASRGAGLRRERFIWPYQKGIGAKRRTPPSSGQQAAGSKSGVMQKSKNPGV
jgi:hypothetical protein